jgi:hypothetical protein
MTTPDTPQTGTGALEAAIEAAMAAAEEHAVHERHDGWACACGATGHTAPVPGSEAHRHLEAAAVRAAAPIIERDALQRAADELRTLAAQLSAGWESEPNPGPTYVAYGQAFKEAARRINEVAEAWLRERAKAVTHD